MLVLNSILADHHYSVNVKRERLRAENYVPEALPAHVNNVFPDTDLFSQQTKPVFQATLQTDRHACLN